MSQSVLYSPFGSGLPVCEYRKQLTPLTVYIPMYIIYLGRSAFCLSQHTVNCPDSTDGTALNASSICLPHITVRRYKDRNNLAKTFIVSRIFCKNSSFFSIFATFYRIFFRFCLLFVCYTLIMRHRKGIIKKNGRNSVTISSIYQLFV